MTPLKASELLERLEEAVPELWGAVAALSDGIILPIAQNSAADVARVACGRAMLAANIFAVLHTNELLASKVSASDQEAVIDKLTRMLTWMTRVGVGSSVPDTPEDQSPEWSARYKALDSFVESNAAIRAKMRRSWRVRVFCLFKNRSWFDTAFVQLCATHLLRSENIVLPEEPVRRFAAETVEAVYSYGRTLSAA